MEEDKFYTPSIEEFHVGFEYERLCPKEDKWKHQVCGKSFKHVYQLLAGEKHKIRVKYLNREDIESLGWKYDSNAEPIPAREGFKLPLAFILEEEKEDGLHQWQLFLYDDYTVWIDYTFNCGGQGYIFKGIVENKSELKKALKKNKVN